MNSLPCSWCSGTGFRGLARICRAEVRRELEARATHWHAKPRTGGCSLQSPRTGGSAKFPSNFRLPVMHSEIDYTRPRS